MKNFLIKYLCVCIVLILIFIPNIYANNSSINMFSSSAIAVDANSDIILYSKSIDNKIYPASTTKILTAILAIENLNLEDTVTISKTAVSIPWDSSSIYLKEGETITIKDLLYGLLLNSRK